MMLGESERSLIYFEIASFHFSNVVALGNEGRPSKSSASLNFLFLLSVSLSVATRAAAGVESRGEASGIAFGAANAAACTPEKMLAPPSRLPADEVGIVDRCVVGAIHDAMEDPPALETLSARDPVESLTGLAAIVNGRKGNGCVMAGRGGV